MGNVLQLICDFDHQSKTRISNLGAFLAIPRAFVSTDRVIQFVYTFGE